MRSGSHRLRTRAARLLASASLLATTTFAASVVTGAPAALAHTADTVALTVVDMQPVTPPITTKPRPLTIRFAVTNLTDQAAKDVVIAGERGDPLKSPAALDAALAAPHEPNPDTAQPITTAKPVRLDLAAHASQTVDLVTTTSKTLGSNICLCTPAGVYPLYFTASVNGVVVGSTQTYMPAFYAEPALARVSWLWPLIDRPHRILADTTFTDDDLAASVDGGRLDRALQTVEAVVAQRPNMPLTLVTDPELLDELAVMSTDSYRVQSPDGKVRPGTGAAAARGWLARLLTLLDTDGNLELVFTPFADPDVGSLARAKLSWSTDLPVAMQARLHVLLGLHVASTTIAWPASGTLTRRAAATLAATGPTTVLLGTASVPDGSLPADGSALTLTTPRGNLTALTTAPDVSSAVLAAVAAEGAGAAALPALVSQIAVRVASDPSAEHRVVLVPPRGIDPAPDVAARAILETTTSFWSSAASLAAASRPSDLGTVRARDLVPRTAGVRTLSDALIAAVATGTRRLPVLEALFTGPPTAGPANLLLEQFPSALQRAESTAWTTEPSTGESYARAIVTAMAAVENGVFIVNRPSGVYTLTSGAILPLTVENDLDYPVRVQVTVQPVNGIYGVRAVAASANIEPHSKRPVRVRVTVERSGRIPVEAALLTTSDVRLGAPVPLYVRSSDLGRVGLVITFASGAVLVLALARRFWQRYRGRPA